MTRLPSQSPIWKSPAVVGAFVASLITGGFAFLATPINAWLSGVVEERDALRRKVEAWEFSEGLFKLLPGDVDFLARNVIIDKKTGAEIQLVGPNPDDWFRLHVSEIRENQSGVFSVVFTAEGVLGGNLITPESFELRLLRNAHAGPINLGNFELYLFVDETNVGSVQLSIARRPLEPSHSGFTNMSVPAGRIRINYKRPPPILRASP